jgi:hypothetical protein
MRNSYGYPRLYSQFDCRGCQMGQHKGELAASRCLLSVGLAFSAMCRFVEKRRRNSNGSNGSAQSPEITIENARL